MKLTIILHRWRAPLLLLLACGLAWGLRFHAGLHKPHVGTDEAKYLIAGRNFWRGEGFTLAPGRPLVLNPGLIGIVQAGLARCLPNEDCDLAGAIVFATAGLWGTLGIFLLGRQLLGISVGIYGAMLFAVLPALAAQSFYWGSGSEALTFSLLTFGWWLYAKSFCGAALSWAVAGAAVFGITAMARQDGNVHFAAASAVLLLRLAVDTFRRRDAHTAQPQPSATLRSVTALNCLPVCLAAAFIIGYAPYGHFLWRHTGRVTSPSALHTIENYSPVAGDNTVADASAGELKPSSLPEYLTTKWRSLVPRTAANTRDLFRFALPHVIPTYLLLAIGAGLLIWRSRGSVWTSLYLAAMAATVLPYLLFYMQPRFTIYLLIPVLLIAARGLAQIDVGGTLGRAAVAASLTAVLGVHTLYHVERYRNNDHLDEFRRAAAWIAEHSDEHDIIMSRKPFVSYYARRNLTGLAGPNDHLLHRAATAAGARYIIYDTRFTSPQYGHLANRKYLADTRLWKTAYAEWDPERTIVVLEVAPPPSQHHADRTVPPSGHHE